jgi:hypothetical protein
MPIAYLCDLRFRKVQLTVSVKDENEVIARSVPFGERNLCHY